MTEVCIVGAGVSGLISAKICLENGLVPFIIEKTEFVGGIWKGQEGEVGAWNSMSANTTKTFMRISDHPWPKEALEFPTRGQVLEYYQSFARKHELFQYIKFNTSVSHICKTQEGYQVTYTSESTSTTRFFSYVILATGFYSKPKNEILHKERFTGQLIHTAYYRDPSIFADKKVVIIGNAYSSCDIASEASNYASSVIQIYKRPTFCLTRWCSGLPYDYLMFNILNRHNPAPLMITKEDNASIMKYFESLFGNPGEII